MRGGQAAVGRGLGLPGASRDMCGLCGVGNTGLKGSRRVVCLSVRLPASCRWPGTRCPLSPGLTFPSSGSHVSRCTNLYPESTVGRGPLTQEACEPRGQSYSTHPVPLPSHERGEMRALEAPECLFLWGRVPSVTSRSLPRPCARKGASPTQLSFSREPCSSKRSLMAVGALVFPSQRAEVLRFQSPGEGERASY